MRIGVVGTGTIATAVVRGIAGDGHQISVSERSAENARNLADAFDNVDVRDNQGVVDASDIVMLGLIVDVAPPTLAEVTFRPEQRVISFMADASLAEVADLVQPATASAVVMPYPAVASGGSAVIAEGDLALVEEIFGVANHVFPVENSEEMAAYLCAQAVLSPATQMVADAAQWLSTHVADGQQGEVFLRHLVASSLAASACGPLLDALSTPGGYNIRLHQQIAAAGTTAALLRALDTLLEG